jgi:hypothetical protein
VYTKTCSDNMVSPNDHVVMNHKNQTPNKWHMMPCSLQAVPPSGAVEARRGRLLQVRCLDALGQTSPTPLLLAIPRVSWKRSRDIWFGHLEHNDRGRRVEDDKVRGSNVFLCCV